MGTSPFRRDRGADRGGCLYAKVLGGPEAARLTLTLVLGALAAGMGVALPYGLTDLTINYKLVPEQLWSAKEIACTMA